MHKDLPVRVREKLALYTGETAYVCVNSDYRLIFDFDAEWSDLETKTARFLMGDGTYRDSLFTGSICPVPVIESTYWLKVGVFAGNLHTTTPAHIPARKSILSDGGLPADPAPDVYAQIMDRLQNIEQTGVSKERLWAVIEEYLTENPIEGVTPEAVAGQVEKALQEAKESGEFDGPQGPQGPKGDAGAPGKDGADGKTPVKGTDYFTAADKSEMVAAVIAALPVYGGETA